MEFNREQIEKDFREMIGPLSKAFGPAGFEQEVGELVQTYLKDAGVELETDAFLNVTARKKAEGRKKVMISAHLDEIGMIIRRIDSDGFLWFETLGGIAPQQFFGKHVIVRTEQGDLDGIVNSLHPGRPARCSEMPKSAAEFFIDIGASSRQEAQEMGVEIGNPVSIDYPVLFLGKDTVAGKALDDRACVFMLVELLRLLKDEDLEVDLYGLFSSQEEVGGRGAVIAAQHIRPEIGIALDMSLACDIPGTADREYVNELGKGVSIKVMDKLSSGIVGVICDQQIVKGMKQTALDRKLNYQTEVYSAGATDASLFHTVAGGIRCGGIQIPMRYVHSYETCSVTDVTDCVELLYYYIKGLK